MRLFPAFLLMGLMGCQTGKKSGATAWNPEFTGKKYGCGNVFIYKANRIGDKVLEISLRRKPTQDTTYSLEIGKSDSLAVRIYTFREKDVLFDFFCNDIEIEMRPIDTLVATRGRLKVKVYRFAHEEAYDTFQVDIEGEEIGFERDGTEFKLKRMRIDSVSAGWLPG